MLLLVAPMTGAGQSAPDRRAIDAIVGTWRGSSICVDRQAAPACTDEQAVYDISPSVAKTDAVTVDAGKVVDGKRESVGTLDFTYEPATASWSTEVETPRVHLRWRLAAKGDALTGTMMLLPSETVVRRITLRRQRATDVK